MKSLWSFCIVVLISLTMPCFACQVATPEVDVQVTVDNSPCAGETVYFDASGSFCDDPGTLEFTWTFPPQAYYVHIDGDTAYCKFSPAGSYDVNLEVKNLSTEQSGFWENTSDRTVTCDDDTLTVSDCVSIWYVSAIDGDNDDDGQSWTNAFETIQMAIDSATDGDEICVDSGDGTAPTVYYEQLDMKGKSLDIHSADPDGNLTEWQRTANTILDAQKQGSAIVYRGNETNSTGANLEGFTITGGYPAGDGLALHLTMDNGSGTTATDASGKERHGTLINDPNWVADGYSNGAMEFDGTDDYVEIQDYHGIVRGNPRTVSAWVKTDGNASSPMVIASWGTPVDGEKWMFRIDSHLSGQVAVGIWGGYIQSTWTVTDGHWHHVAAVLPDDGSSNLNEIKLFIDGRRDYNTTIGNVTDGLPIETSSVESVVVGARTDTTSGHANYFYGKLDEVRIYSRALKDSEILEIANYYDPALHLELETSSGSVTPDTSMRNDGQLSGDAAINWNDELPGEGCLELDGAGYVDLGSTYNYGTVEMLLSMKFKTSSANQWLFDQVEETGSKIPYDDWIELYLDASGQLVFQFSGGLTPVSVQSISPNGYHDNQWHHVVAVKSGKYNLELYVDGLFNNSTVSSVSGGGVDNPEAVNIGRETDGTNYFDGFIDDVQIYRRALTAQEMLDLFGIDILEGHWKLDGDPNDYSDNGFDGTVYGDPSWTDGYFDQGLEFDGDGDYVEIAHANDLSSFVLMTMSAWVYPESGIANYDIIMNKENEYEMAWKDNQLVSAIKTDTNNWFWTSGTGNATLPTGQWTHVAVAWDGNNIYEYINGVLKKTTAQTGNNTLFTTNPLRIGRRGGTAYWNGKIDDVRLYDRVLTANEIKEMANSNSKLLAHWKLDGDCEDEVGGHDGTLQNSPIYTDGISGESISLDSDSSQYVTIPHSPQLKPQFPLTISTWFNIDTPGIGGHLIKTDTSTNANKYSGVKIRLSNTTDQVILSYGDGTSASSTGRCTKMGTSSLQSGHWYHVVGVIRGPQDMSIYLNGVDDGGEYTGSSVLPIYYEGNASYIGCGKDIDKFFDGQIDDICIYNYALSEDRVQSLYQSRFVDGGGLKGHGASVDISICNINDNKTATNGGGLEYCYGSIQNSLITNNTANGVGGGLTGCGDIINCTVAGNSASQAGGLYDCNDLILNCILWANGSSPLVDCAVPSYSDIEDWASGGTGNLAVDPNFIDAVNGNYHLDPNSSLCIDAGNPYSDYSNEPLPNGGRINMGAYGNTSEAAVTVDSDGDGLGDAVEHRLGLDPQDSDSDDDGLTDQEEVQLYGTDALDADTDNDGMTDGWEVDNGGYPTYAGDAGMDYDGDGLTNLQEFQAGTNPHSADSDSDGMPDTWESQYMLDPLDPNDANWDLDTDTYSNVIEYWHNGDPNDPNSLEPRKFIVPTDVDTIQQAIGWSIDGDEIEVLPGTYYEEIDFDGKSITLCGTDPNDWDVVAATVIDANIPSPAWGDFTVLIEDGQDRDTLVSGLSIMGGYAGIFIGGQAGPCIQNCLIHDNTKYNVRVHKTGQTSNVPLLINNKIYNSSEGITPLDLNTEIEIVGNWIFDNSTYAIQFIGQGGVVKNNTITGNYKGIYNNGSTDVSVVNSIIWDNGSSTSYNLIGTFTNVDYSCIEGGYTGTGNISSEPNFVDADNDDYHLSLNSPCLNSGDPNGVYDGQVDIDGDPRVRGVCVDMGADEAPVIWYVDDDANGLSTGFTWTDAFTLIQDAMDAASDNDAVLVAEGTYNENLRFPDKSITVTGTSTDWSTVESTIITVEDPNLPCVLFNTNPETPSTLAGFSVQNGYEGIMIYSQASPEIRHCRITQNQTGISCVWGDPNIVHCRIINNSENGIDVGFGDPTIKSSIIAKNQNGGVTGPILIENCTIADNSGYGVVACEETVLNSIVWNNDSNDLLGASADYSCIQFDDMLGSNISYFPYFADANDYTLMDHSPCIDAGEPNSLYVNEPNDGGFCINLGAYGNTDNATLASPDADSDGLPDTWEALYWSTSDPNDADDDYDADYLSNLAEYRAGTNPTSSDTDGDNVPDFWELLCGLDPRDSTDGNQDQDGDGLTDYQEYQNLTNPLYADTDGDGLPDAWEVRYQLNPLADDSSQDPDNDGLTNLQEYQLGSDPKDSDTDNDGMPDGWEVENELDMLSSADASLDADGDGLTNLQEFQAGTGINQVDTDGDGLSDAWEENNGLDPLDAADKETDLDNDGYSNWVEYLHNGDPNDNDPNQSFDVITITVPTQASTIQEGVDWSIDGDTVLVLPGEYEESVTIDGKAITLTGIETDDWNKITETVIGITGQLVAVKISGSQSNCTINYLMVTKSTRGVYVTDDATATINRCVADSASTGIYCDSGTPIIENCMIGSNNSDGIYLSGATDPVIKNNWIYDNSGDGLEIVSYVNSCLIRNNTIAENGKNEIKYSGDPNYMPQVSNCILWHSGDSDDDVSNCIVSYSCISDGGSGTNISSNPQFIDAANYNFHLDRSSPCIDTGDPNSTYTGETDIAGQVRTAGRIDMGADEVCAVHNKTQDVWYNDFIQDAIDDANDFDMIELYEWEFTENINFGGKSVQLVSTDPNDWNVIESTILESAVPQDPNTSVITFDLGEDANSIVMGITISGATNADGISCENGSSPTISRCIIRDNYNGIYCYSGAPSIFNNKIGYNWGNGGAGIVSDSATPPVIIGNLIYQNDNGIIYTSASSQGKIYNNTIVNNTVTNPEDGGIGIAVDPNCIQPDVANSILWSNDDDLNGVTAKYSCIESVEDSNGLGNISADPQFAVTDDDSYRILAVSPCQTLGDPNRVENHVDIDGQPLKMSEAEKGISTDETIVYAASGNDIGQKWYVSEDGTWEGQSNVKIYLQDAILEAASGDEIWVAKGTYRPDDSISYPEWENDRSKSFDLPENIKLYGGFVGSETSLEQRDLRTNKTVLSGDLGENFEAEVPFDHVDDNSYHVVTAESVQNVLLDGFYISGGDASKAPGLARYDKLGGGLFNAYSQLKINQCVFEYNKTGGGGMGGALGNIEATAEITFCKFKGNRNVNSGSAVANYYTSDRVLIKDTEFHANQDALMGGGICNKYSSCDIVNCVFSKNDAYWGGGIYSEAGDINIINSVFVLNYSTQDGGAISNWHGSADIINCTIFKNTAGYRGGGIFNIGNTYSVNLKNSIVWDSQDEWTAYGSDEVMVAYSTNLVQIQNCNIKDSFSGETWDLDSGTNLGGNIDADPMFIDTEHSFAGPDTIWGTRDDGLRLGVGSPCLDTGNDSSVPSEITTDITGNNRFRDSDDIGTEATVDMGAYEGARPEALAINKITNQNTTLTFGLDESYAEFGDLLDCMLVCQPEHGEAALSWTEEDGYTFEYTPDESFYSDAEDGGEMTYDIFAYCVSDGMWSMPGEIKIDVQKDTDADGLSDKDEQIYETDSEDPDSDDDGYSDGWEIANGYEPNPDEGGASSHPDGNDDTDGDGLKNSDELTATTDPINPDTDGDGMPDGWEHEYGLSPTIADGDDGPSGDPDNDSMSNIEEYEYSLKRTANLLSVLDSTLNPPNSLDPTGTDGWSTDGDSLPDGWEIKYEPDLDPLDDGSGDSDHGDDGDPDGDLLKNVDEFNAGSTTIENLKSQYQSDYTRYNWVLPLPNENASTDPTSSDTDGDGFSDKEELVDKVFFGWWIDRDDVYHWTYNETEFENNKEWHYPLETLFYLNPLTPDTDGDGLCEGLTAIDAVEPYLDGLVVEDGKYARETYSLHYPDVDQKLNRVPGSDGYYEGWEYYYSQFDLGSPDEPVRSSSYNIFTFENRAEDFDGDHLTNYEEFQLNTNPWDWDSDNDQVPDGDEVRIASGGIIEYIADPKNPDADNDGLSDKQELDNNTDPLDFDSDDDGLSDGWEVDNGYDPTEPLQPESFDAESQRLTAQMAVPALELIDGPIGFDKSLSFDGVNQYIEVSDSEFLHFGTNCDFALSFWIKVETAPNQKQYILSRQNNQLGYAVYIGPDGIGASVIGESSQGRENREVHVDFPNNFFGEWCHIAVSLYNSSNHKLWLYVDHIHTDYDNDSDTLSGSFDNAEPLLIGTDFLKNNSFSGQLDNIMLFNDYLNASYIGQLFEASTEDVPSGLENDLVAHYKMNGILAASGDGFRIEDSSSNDLHGTTVNIVSREGMVNGGYFFNVNDDYSDYITANLDDNDGNPTPLTLSQASWGGWFKFETGNQSEEGLVLGRDSAGDMSFALTRIGYAYDNRLDNIYRAYIGNDQIETLPIPNAPSNSGWHFVMATFDGTQTNESERLKLYIDGNLATTSGDLIPAETVTLAQMQIGGMDTDFSKFRGGIDEIAYYEIALNSDDINDIYTRAGGVPIDINPSGFLVSRASAPSVPQIYSALYTAYKIAHYGFEECNNGKSVSSSVKTYPDKDGDGVDCFDEERWGTSDHEIAGDPGDDTDTWDTDGDGITDKEEILRAEKGQPYDPTSENNTQAYQVYIGVGDQSGSNSEQYKIQVGNRQHQNKTYGEYDGKYYTFQPQKYAVDIQHISTNRKDSEGNPKPDYDYKADVIPLGSFARKNLSFDDEFSEYSPDLIGLGGYVWDNHKVLGTHWESSYFYPKTKRKPELIVCKIDLQGRVDLDAWRKRHKIFRQDYENLQKTEGQDIAFEKRNELKLISNTTKVKLEVTPEVSPSMVIIEFENLEVLVDGKPIESGEWYNTFMCPSELTVINQHNRNKGYIAAYYYIPDAYYSNTDVLIAKDVLWVSKADHDEFYGIDDSKTENEAEGGDPVSLKTGAYTLDAVDLQIKGRKLDYSIRRHYSSTGEIDEFLGAGWDMNCNMKLLRGFDETDNLSYVVFYNGNGDREKYDASTAPGKENQFYHPAKPGQFFQYDSDLKTFSLIKKSGTEFTFNEQDYIASISDRHGNQIHFKYIAIDPQFLLPYKIIDDMRRETIFEYDFETLLLKSITDFAGRIWKYKYDENYDLISVTTPKTAGYPEGLTTNYRYDHKHRMTEVYDPANDPEDNGKSYLKNTYEYGRVKTQYYGKWTDPEATDDQKFIFDYDSGLQKVAVTDRNGNVKTTYYNEYGETRAEVVYSAGRSEYDATEYEYDENRQLIKMTLPRGNAVEYQYDIKGNVTKVTHIPVPGSQEDASGQTITTEYTYDESEYNFIDVVKDTRGNETIYTYDYELSEDDGLYVAPEDQKGNLVKITYPPVDVVEEDGQVSEDRQPQITFEYNEYGQIKKMTSPDYIEVAFDYYGQNDFDSSFAGLVGFWQMDDNESDSTVHDVSGLGNHGTLQSKEEAIWGDKFTESRTISGKSARSLELNGNDRIFVEHNDDLDITGAVTISCWVYLDDITKTQYLVSKRTANDNSYSLFMYYNTNSETLYPVLSRGDGQNEDALTESTIDYITAGRWYHIAGTIDGNKCAKLYLDGDLIKEGQFTLTAGGTVSDLLIGTQPSHDHPMHGRIDNVMIFDRSLSQEELLLLKGYQTDRLARVTVDPVTTTNIDGLDIMVDFGYDHFGNITVSLDSEGRLSQMYYNDLEQLVRTISAMNTETEYHYNANKKVDWIRSQLGASYDPDDPITYQEVNYTYNILDKLKSVTDPMGYTTELDYDKNDNVNKATDPEGAVAGTPYFTTTLYDERNLPSVSTDAEGNMTSYTYDANGNVLTVADAEQNVTTYEYDGFDRLVKTKYADTSTEEFAYNSAGNMTWRKSRVGDEFTYRYDSLGRMIEKISTVSPETIIIDNDDSGTSETGTWDLDSSTYSYKFYGDSARRRRYGSSYYTYMYEASEIYGTAVNGRYVISFWAGGYSGYDSLKVEVFGGATGNELLHTSTLDQSVAVSQWQDLDSFVFEGKAKVKLTITGSSPKYAVADAVRFAPIELYSYDISGRLRVVDSGQTAEMEYDRIGRLDTVTDENGKEVGYTYNNDGSVASVTYPDSGGTVYYAYDALGRLEYVHMAAWDRGNQQAQNPKILAHYAYDTLSRRVTVEYNYDYETDDGYDPEGVPEEPDYDGKMTYTYTDSERVTSTDQIGHWLKRIDNDIDVVNSDGSEYYYQYDYDKAGNRISLTDHTDSYSYTYDKAYQIKTADNPSGFADITTGTSDGITYDSVYNRVSVPTSSGTITYTVNNNVNQYDLVNTVAHEYDANANLKNDGVYKYTYDAESRLVKIKTIADADLASYTYDNFGRRNSKTVGATTTTYVYDGSQVIAEYDNDTLARIFIYGPGIDEPIAMKVLTGDNQGLYFYYYDGLGSVCALSNTSGSIAEQYRYDVFGDTKILDSLGAEKTSGFLGNPYMFTGRRLDTETRASDGSRNGLYYYRARMYYPELGRFMQTDPIGYYDSMNLYQYAFNSPTNYIDPWGLKQTEKHMRWRDKAVRAVASGFYYVMPSEKYVPGLQRIFSGVAGISGGTAILLATGEPTTFITGCQVLVGVGTVTGGTGNLVVGGAHVIGTAAGEDTQGMENVPTTFGGAYGRSIGELAGNGEKGQAVGEAGEATVDLIIAGQGLKKAANALEVVDSLVSGGSAVQTLAGGIDTISGDNDGKPIKNNDK